MLGIAGHSFTILCLQKNPGGRKKKAGKKKFKLRRKFTGIDINLGQVSQLFDIDTRYHGNINWGRVPGI